MQSFKNLASAALGIGALAVAISIPSLTPSSVSAQVITPPVAAPVLRAERGSAKNLVHVRRRLEAMIDQLQRDAHDYGGYRVKAIADLQAARNDIQTAISYDATHGR